MGGASSALLLQLLDACSAITAGDLDEAECLSKRSLSRPLAAEGRDVGVVGVPPPQAPSAFFPGCNLCTIVEDSHPLVVEPISYEFIGIDRRQRAYDSEATLLRRKEELVRRLFDLHDLNHNGVLEELELIKLNEKIAMLHHGKDVDRTAVREKYTDLFRRELDADGNAVSFAQFRDFMLKTLHELDRDVQAQEMIMEQFVAEAKSGRDCFRCESFYSVTDAPFRSIIEANDSRVSSPVSRM
eukprot:TRINITY_DN2047_c0_g2_i1.p1 TRINITY_DN2047_c0_g2~~TRINITY_DN2047_c0_g2_i1.p1  ORF type:complete len:242 (-),score=63.45 TRINITY_DN2047_c0_g2_i1:665-1390(-)